MQDSQDFVSPGMPGCLITEVPALDLLELFDDEVERNGPEQMALDEVLLEEVTVPVLRSYRWAGEWVSFGYSQSYSLVEETSRGRGLVRRWTGGGIVEHGRDWTFALIVPRGCRMAMVRPGESYCQIHEAVAMALQKKDLAVKLAGESPAVPPGACFAGTPARHDVLDQNGRKLCGGAQRRTRCGMLHQGSVQGLALSSEILSEFGEALSHERRGFVPSHNLLRRAWTLAEAKYGKPEWLRRLP